MTWQEFAERQMPLGNNPTREQWQAALDHARSLLPQVDDADRITAEDIIVATVLITRINECT